MITELLFANAIALASILVVLLVRGKSLNLRNPRLAKIKNVFSDEVKVHPIPKFEDETESDLIASSSSKKYHKANCRLAETIKNKVTGSLEFFQDKGYSPCGICMKK